MTYHAFIMTGEKCTYTLNSKRSNFCRGRFGKYSVGVKYNWRYTKSHSFHIFAYSRQGEEVRPFSKNTLRNLPFSKN